MSSTADSDSFTQYEVQALEIWLRTIWAGDLLECAVLAAYSYNFLLTIADEIEYVWTRKWTMGSSIYFLARYLPLPCIIYHSSLFLQILNPNLSEPSSVLLSIGTLPIYEIVPFPSSILGSIVLFASMVLLQLRTYAVYTSKKALLWTFGILDFFALAAFISLSIGISALISVLWIPLFFVEATTFGLIAHKYWKMYKASKAIQITQSALLEAIVRGNTGYFAIIAVFYVFGATLLVGFDGESQTALMWNAHYVASVAMSGLISTKLFIDLKRTFVKQLEEAHLGPAESMPFQVAPRDQYRLTLTSEP